MGYSFLRNTNVCIYIYIYSQQFYTTKPGMNMKIMGTRLILRPSPKHGVFCVSSRCRLNHEDTVHPSYRPVHVFTILITECLWSPLSNGVCIHKSNMLLPMNVTCNSLPVASVCNLLKQNYILNENSKFSANPSYKTKFTQTKSP